MGRDRLARESRHRENRPSRDRGVGGLISLRPARVSCCGRTLHTARMHTRWVSSPMSSDAARSQERCGANCGEGIFQQCASPPGVCLLDARARLRSTSHALVSAGVPRNRSAQMDNPLNHDLLHARGAYLPSTTKHDDSLSPIISSQPRTLSASCP